MAGSWTNRVGFATDAALGAGRLTAPRPPAGFTLLELLIAMTVLGLLMAVLANGLRLGIRSWSAVESRQAAEFDLRLTQSIMRSRLSAAFPAPAPALATEENGDGVGGLAFVGEPNRVGFVNALAPPVGVGGLFWIEFAIAPGRGGRELIMSQQRFPPPKDGVTPAIEQRVLLAGIATAQFTYLAVDEDGGKAQWQPKWENAEALPPLVRLDLAFDRGDRRGWPDLVVAPAVVERDAVASPGPVRRAREVRR